MWLSHWYCETHLMPAWKMSKNDVPTKYNPSTQGNQWILGFAVQPMRKKPMGNRMLPSIIGGKRISGSAFPPLRSRCGPKTLVEYSTLIAADVMQPNKTAKNGRLPTSVFQPRSCSKMMGTAAYGACVSHVNCRISSNLRKANTGLRKRSC